MYRCGVPKPALVCMFSMLQNLQHHVWTLYGDSTIWAGTKIWAVPVVGIGQGNGTGLQIWAVVSTPILDLLQEEGYGAAFKAVVSGDNIQFVGYSFANNTDLIQTGPTINSMATETLPLMQVALDLWNNGLSTTGGALVLDKSFWYLIDFKWTSGCWSYMPKATETEPLMMNDHQGSRCPLLWLHTSEAWQTLGVYLTLEMATINYKKKLTHKNLGVGTKHMGCPPRLDSGMAEHHNNADLASILCATGDHNDTQPMWSNHVTMPYGWDCHSQVQQILPMGYPPREKNGLNLTDMYMEQGIQHALTLLQYGHSSDNLTGWLIRGSLETLILELGIPDNPFTQDYTALQLLATNLWIKAAWQFQNQPHIQIETDLPTINSSYKVLNKQE